MSARMPDKWIQGLDASAPVSTALQVVLAERMQVVSRSVRSVIKSAAQDNERVHQLRVSTRRAEAALLAFAPWLRKGLARRARTALRDLRHAAGRVRDDDVHNAILHHMMDAADPDGLIAIEHSLMLWSLHRPRSLKKLLKRAKSSKQRLPPAGAQWARKSEQLDDDQSRSDDLRSAGDRSLQDLASSLLALAEQDLHVRENLHSLRVQGKRLRYAIEIFGGTATQRDVLEPLSAELASFQEMLGSVNDYHEVADRLAQNAASVDEHITGQSPNHRRSTLAKRIEAVADACEHRCIAQIQAFLEWWGAPESTQFRDRIASLARGTPESIAPPMQDPPVPEVVVHVSGNGLANSLDETSGALNPACEGKGSS